MLIVIPALVLGFYAIHRHYRTLARQLSLEHFGPPTRVDRHRVVLAVSGVHRGTLAGLHYARALSQDVTAVYVAADAESAADRRGEVGPLGRGRPAGDPELAVPAVARAAARLHPRAVQEKAAERGDDGRGAAVRTARRWHNLLHAQTAMMLRLALMFEPGIVITSVPYQVGGDSPP